MLPLWYNKNMKCFVLILTAIMFLANTFIVSAWAKPCINMNTPSSTAQSMEMDESAAPCPMMSKAHNTLDTAQQDQRQDHDIPHKHCEGMCLCLHASIQQMPITVQFHEWNIVIDQSDYILARSQLYVSQSIAPPYEPPKKHV
jgi:hypothetical protein